MRLALNFKDWEHKIPEITRSLWGAFGKNDFDYALLKEACLSSSEIALSKVQEAVLVSKRVRVMAPVSLVEYSMVLHLALLGLERMKEIEEEQTKTSIGEIDINLQ